MADLKWVFAWSTLAVLKARRTAQMMAIRIGNVPYAQVMIITCNLETITKDSSLLASSSIHPIKLNRAFALWAYCLETKRIRTVSISLSKVMEATQQRKRVLPQWLLECSANYHVTKEPNPPPTKRSKMSREEQLLGRVMGMRPLKDISNYAADPKQRRREKDSARKRAARAKKSDKEKAKRLNYQKEYVKDKRCR